MTVRSSRRSDGPKTSESPNKNRSADVFSSDASEVCSDEKLLERYAQGDVQAFEQFFVRHQGRVYHYALKKLREPQSAAEVTQDVFVKLHAKIHQYHFNERALTWFFSIVHNACVDEIRRATKRNQSGFSESLIQHQVNQKNDVREKSTEGEDLWSLSNVEQTLGRLSFEQRKILEQRVMNEKSFRQISHESGKSEVALRKLYSRAVEKLRFLLVTERKREDDK